jgi:hypothetical protein
MPFYTLDPRFLAPFLWFSNLSKPGISLSSSESLSLLVAVSSRAVFSASAPELISILGDIELEARF